MTVPSDSEAAQRRRLHARRAYALKPDGLRPAQRRTTTRWTAPTASSWSTGTASISRSMRGCERPVAAGRHQHRTTMEDDCEVVSKVPEMLLVNLANVGNAAVLIPTGTPTAWRPRSSATAKRRGSRSSRRYGVYIVPKIDAAGERNLPQHSRGSPQGERSTRTTHIWRPTRRSAGRWREARPTSRSTSSSPTRCISTAGTSWTCGSGRSCGRDAPARS